MRHWLPDHTGGVFWFGVDDATFSGTDSQKFPVYWLKIVNMRGH